jgi:isoquinoline 1-oxidoreductase beta subunit
MEHMTEAVLLARAAGRPVKVVGTREEDFRVDQHRTAFLERVRMGLGADGTPVAYEAKIACDGLWQRPVVLRGEEAGGLADVQSGGQCVWNSE